MTDFSKYKLATIRHRGDPKSVVLESGHRVEKQEFLYYTKPSDGAIPEGYAAVEAAEYHDEHFLYVDPLYQEDGNRGHWFAMCTCGSPAVEIAAIEADKLGIPHKQAVIVVCMFYTNQLMQVGPMHAKHQTSYITGRK